MSKEKAIEKAQAYMVESGKSEIWATSDGSLFDQKHFASSWAATKRLEYFLVKAKAPKKEAPAKKEPMKEVVEKLKAAPKKRRSRK